MPPKRVSLWKRRRGRGRRPPPLGLAKLNIGGLQTIQEEDEPPTAVEAPKHVLPVDHVEDDLPTPSNALTAPHPVVWAAKFPALYQYYQQHKPDFAGGKLYAPDVQWPVDFSRVHLRNPTSFTFAVLFAEMAREQSALISHALLSIKTCGLAMLRNMLADPGQHHAADLVHALASIVANELVFGSDLTIPRAHLMGLSCVVEARGGLATLEAQPVIRNLIYAVDGLHAHLTGSPRVFPSPDAAARRAKGVSNPFRLAIQPTTSGLPPARLNNHLLISIGAPIQFVLETILEVGRVARSVLVAPYAVAPAAACNHAVGLEYRLHKLGDQVIAYGLVAPVFSERDKARHEAVVEVVRLYALALVNRLIDDLQSTLTTNAALDHSAQTLILAADRYRLALGTDIYLWAYYSGAAFVSQGPQRGMLGRRIAGACAEQPRPMHDWETMRGFLQEWSYTPEIQEASGAAFWNDVCGMVDVKGDDSVAVVF